MTIPDLLLKLRPPLVLALAVAAALLIIACSDGDVPPADVTATPGSPTRPAGPAMDEVTFMAGFKPQANLPFVGVYVAQEKGFFAEENLAVNVEHVATPGDNFRFLAAGEVQFTTADAQVLLERRAGDPPIDLVSLALIGQRGQQGFAVLADSGIRTPADWKGKTAGYKGSQVTPDYVAILAANGLTREDVNEVRVGFDPRILTEGQVDIFPVFISNEPNILLRMGYNVEVFEAADYGAPTLGLAYVALNDYVDENPDITQRFLNAVIRGIDYADLNREEAVDIVLRYAPEEDRQHQRYMLETELAAALPVVARPAAPAAYDGACVSRAAAGCPAHPSLPWGGQTQEQWQRLHDFLVQYGALPGPLPDITRAFRTEFIEEAHRKVLELVE
jgi:ABC-type nitrate/sulfonate/bicarbonate transport system substrate-binding protein